MIKNIRYRYKEFSVEICNEENYKLDSNDNEFNYSKILYSNKNEAYFSSFHGIKVILNKKVVQSCLIVGSEGATGINENSSNLDNDSLLLCCSNFIFNFNLPDLKLNWELNADPIACFQIYKYQDKYIVHGEMQISMLNKDGEIEWEFGGADIFVSLGNENEFILKDDGILLTDFNKRKYKIDFEGKLINENK